MPPGEDFDNNGCFFQNLSLCGSLAGHGSGVWYNTPIGQWGGRIKYSPAPALYVQAGAFQYNPAYATRHGSFQLDGTGHLGYMYLFELGYRPTLGAAKLPGIWKLGDGITRRTPMMCWMMTMAIPMCSRTRPPGDTTAATEVISMSSSS
jgi:porin